ncbi:MAG: electron transport complex subunit RsxC [Candidatus Eisenbacteria bacterium]|uniref:Ion-translocating oxidoreductase complex subunit C n=1 Tax=Eiseniibacteriota bacterium TaxID=2212470 RepID=A0A956N8W3_UNCEI|nr:electron transport complex subunit RsxC [Candidatus Eisenbacteria bacterium]
MKLLTRTFPHGVHPKEHKDTAPLPIERMPFTDRYVLPLAQHIGAPSKGIVKVGQHVERGEKIAEPGGFVSVALHSPVTGTVRSLDPKRHPNGSLVPAIEIEIDRYAGQETPRGTPADPQAGSIDDFVARIQQMGLVGLGGAAFPAHVKYRIPDGAVVKELLVNGCECEPYLTCDHRVMLENAEDVVRGSVILRDRIGAHLATIGVERNKLDAVAALQEAAKGDDRVRVVPLEVKYPQGAEKMLVKAVLGVEVPAGKLPLEVGVLVNNVSTVACLADIFDRGTPLVERVVTVAGPAVRRPSNLIVPIGTPVRAVLEYCGGLTGDAREIVMGGPMMGQPLGSIDVPVIKGTSGLLAFTESKLARPAEYHCLKCGRCVEACPVFLNPSRLARLAKVGKYEDMERFQVMDCMECGSCSYACPSNIPIVQLIRVSKSWVRERQRDAKIAQAKEAAEQAAKPAADGPGDASAKDGKETNR